MIDQTQPKPNGASPSSAQPLGNSAVVAPTPAADTYAPTMMRVKKRNGASEPVDVNKIVRAVGRSCNGLQRVDALRVATKTISGLYDGATTSELDRLSIQTAAALIVEEPEYARLSARLLATYIDKEVSNQDIHSFSQSIQAGVRHGLIGERVAAFVQQNARKLNAAVDPGRNDLFEYFGLRTVYDRYLLKNPQTREVIETPQDFFLRVACALTDSAHEAIELYQLFSSLEYLPSSPTLFNSGTRHEQLSSCFLLDSPQDDLEAIYKSYSDIARLSKFSGGIGVAFHRVRARGSLIKSTNGHSNGIVPWLKTLDASVAAVNQGGKRKGAACVYLETWHADFEDFLELRENTGDEARRTHNLNLACWTSDLFMRRVEQDGDWTFFDPKAMPHLTDLYGEAFEQAYVEGEKAGKGVKTVKARDLYSRMMKTLAQTGNGWMTFKDASNKKSNQTLRAENVIHLSNLCTEILEITNSGETAVCNLGSLNLGRYVVDGKFDFAKLHRATRLALKQLDRVIDLNFYPIPEAKAANQKWRPVGLGVMGLQDVFFQLKLAFDAPQARELSARIAEEIYYAALCTSADLAEQHGPHPSFQDTRAAQGQLQFDLWGVKPTDLERWELLKARIQKVGLRNSLMIAIAPTATIASIAGCYECIEPQVSNLFKRETLSGDFLQVNKYLVRDLQALGLWNDDTRNRIKMSEGSVQDLAGLPDSLKLVYRTAWEVPMRSLIDMQADRGAFIDQSASLNLFVESPNIGKLSSMYFYAWQKGLKTTYYLRSRPATRIAKTTVSNQSQQGFTPAPTQAPAQAAPAPKQVSDAEAVACSLENPEACEACQ